MVGMSNQLGALNSVNALLSKAFKQPKGDFAERLCAQATVLILALCSVVLGSSHIWGEPVTCWSPAQFNKDWSTFVNQYCYVHGTYYVNLDDDPKSSQLSFVKEEREKNFVVYYQWVPYILAVMAFSFYMPRFMWKRLCSYSGYDLPGAIRYVDDFWSSIKNNDASFRTRIAAFEGRPALFIWDGLRLARRKRGRDLATFYFLASLFQTVNCWVQFIWINGFVGSTEYTLWGPNVLVDLMNGRNWEISGHFPRITHCDFKRRFLASTPTETVLCVLHLNIYYEKICLFLWFWLVFVAIVSTIHSICALASLCMSNNTKSMVSDFLCTGPDTTGCPSKERFFRALGKDGLFVVQQMARNLGDIPSSYLAIAMRNSCSQYEESFADSDDERYLIKASPKSV